MALMVQCELRNDRVRKITWLPQDKRVKVGTVITLLKDDRRWLVTQIGNPVDQNEIQHGWRVGGIA